MKNLLIAVVGASVSFALMACTDYQGDYSDKYEAAVSEVFLSPSNGGANTITDKRDNQSYEVVQIGSQTWFAQNLNYNDGKGKCPADKDSLCEKYGRLYDANSILRVIHIDDSTQKDVFDKLRSLCPEGWRVPNKSDWKTLIDYVANAYDEVGKNLKASEGWYKEGKMIQDANNDLHFAVATGDNPYGFSAFPSGVCWTSSCDVGADSYFWGIADTVLAKAVLTTMLVGYKLSFENDDFVENSDMNYSNNPRAAIRCIQGEITEPYVDRSSSVQLEDEDIEKDTTDLNLSSSSIAKSSSSVAKSSSSVAPSSSSNAKSSSSVASTAKYDCSLYDCVTTKYLNQDMLAAGKYGEYLDVRDTQVYRTVTIGTQTWMAQSLKYVIVKKNSSDTCSSVGCEYKWAQVMDLDSSYNDQNAASLINRVHQGICPDSFHVPTNSEFQELYDYVKSAISKNSVTTELNSSYAWETKTGDDEFGFSMAPMTPGGRAAFWTASEVSYYRSYRWFKDYEYNSFSGEKFSNTISDEKFRLLQLRCLKD